MPEGLSHTSVSISTSATGDSRFFMPSEMHFLKSGVQFQWDCRSLKEDSIAPCTCPFLTCRN